MNFIFVAITQNTGFICKIVKPLETIGKEFILRPSRSLWNVEVLSNVDNKHDSGTFAKCAGSSTWATERCRAISRFPSPPQSKPSSNHQYSCPSLKVLNSKPLAAFPVSRLCNSWTPCSTCRQETSCSWDSNTGDNVFPLVQTTNIFAKTVPN